MFKILIAEDSPTVLMVLKKSFEQEGFEVETAADGIKALSLSKSSNPDLIILDCILPGLDGYSICRMLKFDDRYKSIPIFMFTARNAESDEKLGISTGADEYIPKSSSLSEIDLLIKKVKEYLN